MIVTLRPQVESDVDYAASFYHLVSPALGHAFLDELRDALRRIESNPELYQRVHPRIRRGLTRRFPFAIYYLIETSGVDVIAILHTARNPRIWKGRG